MLIEMLKGTVLIGKVNLLYDRTVRITPTPLDRFFCLYEILLLY